MNSFSDFNALIKHIEDNLFDNIDVSTLAKMAKLSVYEFRRIFSFVVGFPVYEYIRKRRFSRCIELLLNGESLSNVSSMCGYDNPSSFSRAFKDFHGFSPNDLSKNLSKIKSFTKVGFDISVKGSYEIEYKIVNTDAFYVEGVKEKSDILDTECCENVWQIFSTSKTMENCLQTDENVYAVYENSKNQVLCTIGRKVDISQSEYATYIPASRWVCFTLTKTEDEYVNSFYKNVMYSWFDSTSFIRRDDLPNLEVFPADMSGDFVWDIYIPIK